MHELNRIRLVGIGPRGARYSDVTLDLSNLGDTVEARTLFDAPTRRPSPFSLLLLENGGGKSVLLKLLFSVVLPGRRNTVSGAALDKFVLDDDTGHVAMEWMNVRTGDRLVTAKVYQPRARTASDSNPLAEAWYSFRPSETLALDNLPVTHDGRRRRLDGYKNTLEEADRRAPTTQLCWLGTDQGRWREHLRERGIEPDLFDIQRRMNIDEGEAAKAFKYASSKDFVNWLLTTVTDPKDTSSIADTFAQWATTLAEREQMMLERDFLNGTIARLDPVADAHRVKTETAKAAGKAAHDAECLYDDLIRRHRAEQASSDALSSQVDEALRLVTSRSTERDAARATLNEVHLQTLQLELADADAAESDAQRKFDEANIERIGWEILPALDERDRAISIADALAAQVAAATEDAAPLLHRRDETAARLLAKYYAEADIAETDANNHDSQARLHEAEAAIAKEEWGVAGQLRATATERLRATRLVIADAGKSIATCAEQGIVPTGTTAAQIADLIDHARDLHDARMRELTHAKAVHELTITRVHDTDRSVRTAESEQRATTDRATTATQTLDDVVKTAEAIGATETIRDLLGIAESDTDPSEPTASELDGRMLPAGEGADIVDDAADRLLPLLTADIETHTEREDQLRAAQHVASRILESLGAGGLLPPRPEVEAALDVLENANVVAYAGWRYLHDAVPATQRAEIIANYPALADGIVLIDPQQTAAAQQALLDAQLLPAAAVAVDSGAAFLSLPPQPRNEQDSANRSGFVIDPTPALYDEDAAAARRNELYTQMNRRADELAELRALIDVTEGVHRDLAQWRRANPPGRLAQLRAGAASATRRAIEAQSALEAAETALAQAKTEKEKAEVAATGAADAERAAADLTTKRETLLSVAASAVKAARELPTLEADVRRHDRDAADADRRSVDAAEKVETAIRAAEQTRSKAQRLRAACASVPSTSGQHATEVPAEPLAELKAAAEAAQQVYAAAEVDPDLRHQANDAAEKAQRCRDVLATRDHVHIAQAEQLRATSAGADQASWTAGAANARTRCDRLDEQIRTASKLVGRLQEAVRGARPAEPARSWTTLPDRLRPSNTQHGHQLEVVTRNAYNTAQEALDDANNVHEQLMKQAQNARENAQRFHQALLRLEVLLGPVPTDVQTADDAGLLAGYRGDAAAAEADSKSAVETYRTTQSAAEKAKNELAETARTLVGFANHTRYEALTTPVRRSIVDSAPDLLASHAADWSAALQSRLATLSSDLENANRFRNNIVDRLTALVDQALKTLRQATRLSKLPEDLNEWGGRPFLSIRFTDPDTTAISVRVGEVVDNMAADYADHGANSMARKATRRDGMALLLESIHASVPKGFTVDVLKPDSVLRDERVSIEEMNNVFSGGQELTAAIVLYCTLAALRANERGQMRNRHSGVLFLDNPIGRANASYLLDLQKSVARSLGVQLIYTTGISDDRVLAAFPLWVRLRNDADLRAALKHIRVAEVVRNQLPVPYTAAELANPELAAGTVTAARVYLRPQSPHDPQLPTDGHIDPDSAAVPV
ncbi:hypothetical protein JWS13_04120 (plasmid) [Rhodococcus pseudokoreensis]|uniref:Chromosome segregation ATPase n=1 Tax=Rhodococcus pseudokoreensis TaxID=2811421 RepID=A0A974ZRY5_9NOCA|nr:hypothetical protein [Rhodococcus pseudokoreensis]QSE87852.1 hypothetical protein JWS13_04120 [Rhodococcus pseudokoreensis]